MATARETFRPTQRGNTREDIIARYDDDGAMISLVLFPREARLERDGVVFASSLEDGFLKIVEWHFGNIGVMFAATV